MRPSHRALGSRSGIAFMFAFLVRKAVVEKHVSCQHHGNPRNASCLPSDVLVVILVVISLKPSSSAFGDEIHITAWFGSSFVLTSMSFFFTGMTDVI